MSLVIRLGGVLTTWDLTLYQDSRDISVVDGWPRGWAVQANKNVLHVFKKFLQYDLYYMLTAKLKNLLVAELLAFL